MQVSNKSLKIIHRRAQIINRVFNEPNKRKWNQLRLVFTYYKTPHPVSDRLMWHVFGKFGFISERGFRKILKELIDLEIIVVENGIGILNAEILAKMNTF